MLSDQAVDEKLSDVDDKLEPVRLGRPRDETRDLVILNAALDLVAEVGYERVTMDAIANRAHASKATIYRRWDSKGALVAAAVRCRHLDPLVLGDEGGLRDDLLAAVTLMARSMGEQDLALLTGIFAGMRSDPDLADALRRDMLAEKVSLIAPVFERARARGEFVRDDAGELFNEVAPAVVMHRIVAAGLPADEAFLTHIVDDVLIPILTLTLTTGRKSA